MMKLVKFASIATAGTSAPCQGFDSFGLTCQHHGAVSLGLVLSLQPLDRDPVEMDSRG